MNLKIVKEDLKILYLYLHASKIRTKKKNFKRLLKNSFKRINMSSKNRKRYTKLIMKINPEERIVYKPYSYMCHLNTIRKDYVNESE